MKNLLAIASASALVALAAPAFAETDASIGYSSFDVGSQNLNAITGRVGWAPGDPGGANGVLGVGVEGEVSLGLGSDTMGTGTSRVSAKLSSEYGVFGTLTAATDGFSVFARVGYANIDAKSTTGTGSTATHKSFNEGGLAYGAGAALNLGEASAVRVDYTHYDVDLGAKPAAGSTPAVKGHDANTWSLSFVQRFK